MRSSTQSTANRLHSYQKLTALDDDRNIFYSSQTSWKALRMECCKFPGDIVSFLLNCNTKKAYHVTISRFKTQVSNSTEDPRPITHFKPGQGGIQPSPNSDVSDIIYLATYHRDEDFRTPVLSFFPVQGVLLRVLSSYLLTCLVVLCFKYIILSSSYFMQGTGDGNATGSPLPSLLSRMTDQGPWNLLNLSHLTSQDLQSVSLNPPTRMTPPTSLQGLPLH